MKLRQHFMKRESSMINAFQDLSRNYFKNSKRSSNFSRKFLSKSNKMSLLDSKFRN